jgi:hypothetical protein
MKLLTPILGGFALTSALIASISYFTLADSADRGSTVQFFIQSACLFAFLSLVSIFFSNPKGSSHKNKIQINKIIGLISLFILGIVGLFLAVLGLYWLLWTVSL